MMKGGRAWLCLAGLLFGACGRIGYERLGAGGQPVDAREDRQDVAEDATEPPDASPDAAETLPPVDAARLDHAGDPLAEGPSDGPGDAGDAGAETSSGCAGCPAGLTVTDRTVTALQGGTGSPRVAVGCRSDEVVTSILGAADGAEGEPTYGHLGLVCANLAPRGDVVVVPVSRVGPSIGDTTRQFSAPCPNDQVLVGFEGSTPTRLGSLRTICSALSVFGGGGRISTLAPTGPLSVQQLPGRAGSPDFPRTICPPGQVAAGAQMQVADGRILGFGLICGTAYYVAP